MVVGRTWEAFRSIGWVSSFLQSCCCYSSSGKNMSMNCQSARELAFSCFLLLFVRFLSCWLWRGDKQEDDYDHILLIVHWHKKCRRNSTREGVEVVKVVEILGAFYLFFCTYWLLLLCGSSSCSEVGGPVVMLNLLKYTWKKIREKNNN